MSPMYIRGPSGYKECMGSLDGIATQFSTVLVAGVSSKAQAATQARHHSKIKFATLNSRIFEHFLTCL